MNTTMTTERITKFYKKYFTEMKEELLNGEEVMLIPRDFSDEDNEVSDYLEYNCIGYSNEEILEMIDSEVE